MIPSHVRDSPSWSINFMQTDPLSTLLLQDFFDDQNNKFCAGMASTDMEAGSPGLQIFRAM